MAARGRLVALDQMRGIVMLLMTIDHASGAFNAGRVASDTALKYVAGTPIDPAQFITRWITHLCAPTFVFLAGAGLALSTARRQAAGQSEAHIDRDIAIRGLLLIVLELAWMSWIWPLGVRKPFSYGPGLQVLYAIGGAMLCMVPLRRLQTRWLLIGAVTLIVGYEVVAMQLPRQLPVLLLLRDGRASNVAVTYPLLPWLAIMMLGWVFGRHIPSPKQLALWGLAALALFVVVRGLNDYGNGGLYRDDGSLVQWLHVAKYPPSLAYDCLELGIMALVLAALMHLDRPGPGWLVTLGQTALFYYLLHVHVLKLASMALGMTKAEGLGVTYLSAALVIAILLPLCYWYRGYKSRHPDSWVRFV